MKALLLMTMLICKSTATLSTMAVQRWRNHTSITTMACHIRLLIRDLHYETVFAVAFRLKNLRFLLDLKHWMNLFRYLDIIDNSSWFVCLVQINFELNFCNKISGNFWICQLQQEKCFNFGHSVSLMGLSFQQITFTREMDQVGQADFWVDPQLLCFLLSRRFLIQDRFPPMTCTTASAASLVTTIIISMVQQTKEWKPGCFS